MADVLPEADVRIRITRTRSDGHGARRKQAEQLRACPPATNLAAGARLKIVVERRGRRRPQGCLRRKAIDHRHVFEDVAHAITVAFTVPLVQRAHEPLDIGLRVPRTDQTSPDLTGSAPERLRLQSVAAE